ncbi:hypothetical protein ABKN59_003217 [Abortiporus biennis]
MEQLNVIPPSPSSSWMTLPLESTENRGRSPRCHRAYPTARKTLRKMSGVPKPKEKSSSVNTKPFRRPNPANAATGWSALSKITGEYDEEKVTNCKEDMDTLLVSAGLFSAVVTAFNVETYKMLYTTSTTSHMTPTFSAIRINVLWFSSLVFSLMTASLAMLVKQWLREYLAQECISPQERSRIRHFRHSGLKRWGVFHVAAALPLLLQVALVLFFIGLSDFLRSINHAVGYIVTALITVWFIVFSTTTISPAVVANSPFKTPLLRPILRYIHKEVYRLIHSRDPSVMQDGFPGDEKIVRRDGSSDIDILVATDEIFMDDEVLTFIKYCLSSSKLSETVECLRRLASNRLRNCVHSLKSIGTDCLTLNASRTLSEIAHDAIYRELDSSQTNGLQLTWSDFGEAFEFMVKKSTPINLDFGHLLERLLVQDVTVPSILTCLGERSLSGNQVVLPDNVSLNDPLALGSIITGSHQILDNSGSSVAQLGWTVFTLAHHFSDETIEHYSDDLKYLFLRLSASILEYLPSASRYSDWSFYESIRACLQSCTRFEERLPGIVAVSLIQTLNDVHAHFSSLRRANTPFAQNSTYSTPSLTPSHTTPLAYPLPESTPAAV